MENDAASPPPTRDQFEHRKDFVRAYDRWRDKHDPRRKLRQKVRTEAGYQKKDYDKHRERRLAAKKAEYELRRAELLERQAKWRDGNRDKLKARDKKYYEADKAKFYANNWLRRQTMVAAAPPWLTREHWQAIAEMYEEARRLTDDTGIKHVVDHVWPLRGKHSCGLHVPWNLRVILHATNARKGNGEPD
jgi:hypothetical protein